MDSELSYLGHTMRFLNPSSLLVPMAGMLDPYCTDTMHHLQQRLLEVLTAAVGIKRDSPPHRVLVGFCLTYLTRLLTAQAITLHDMPGHCSCVVNSPSSYSGGHKFESLSDDWLHRVVSWFFSVHPSIHQTLG
jgi:hypothetical protein